VTGVRGRSAELARSHLAQPVAIIDWARSTRFGWFPFRQRPWSCGRSQHECISPMTMIRSSLKHLHPSSQACFERRTPEQPIGRAGKICHELRCYGVEVLRRCARALGLLSNRPWRQGIGLRVRSSITKPHEVWRSIRQSEPNPPGHALMA